MLEAGYWATGIATLAGALAGWQLGRRKRAPGYLLFGLALFLWGFAVAFFIENCGAGGGCEGYATWPDGKAMLVAGVPPVVAGGAAAMLARLMHRPR